MKLRDMLQAYMPGFLITHADASITAENTFHVTSSVSHAVGLCAGGTWEPFHRGPFQSPATSLWVKEADSCKRRALQHWLEYVGVCAGFAAPSVWGATVPFLEITFYF